jgi:hypothetical protein
MAIAAESDACAISDISDVPDKKHIFCGTHSESDLTARNMTCRGMGRINRKIEHVRKAYGCFSRVLDFCIFYFIFPGRMSTPLNAPPEYIHYLH